MKRTKMGWVGIAGPLALGAVALLVWAYRPPRLEGFLIYSVGMNKVDDGGIVAAGDWFEQQGDLAPNATGTKEQRDLWLR